MRKILIPILLLASLSAVAQLKENILRVDSVNTPFLEKYYPKQLVRIAADSVWYSLTHATLVGQSMQTVKDSGWYKIVGGSGTESDPYYRADTSKIAYLDQQNTFTKAIYAIGTPAYGDSIPNLGDGSRLIWNPRKAAFRAGYVDGTQWDDINTGTYSSALGYCVKANGFASRAYGANLTASGDMSTAIGSNSIASGYGSFSIGVSTISSSEYSMAFGVYSMATGINATAFGDSTRAYGRSSTSFGHHTAANFCSTSFGDNTLASGLMTTSFGYRTKAESYLDNVFGRYNIGGGSDIYWINTDPLFEIGNGTDLLNKSNAFTVYKNGNTKIGGTLTVVGSVNETSPDSLVSVVDGEYRRSAVSDIRDAIVTFVYAIRSSTQVKDTLHATDHTVIMISTGYSNSNPDTLNIPSAVGKKGMMYVVQYNREDPLRVICPSDVYYSGGFTHTTEYTFTQYYTLNLEFQSDGTNWYCIRQEEYLHTP